MTLPARREDPREDFSRPRPRKLEQRPLKPETTASPANQLLKMLEEAHEPIRPQPSPAKTRKAANAMLKRFGNWLLGWSCAALLMSVGYLGFETLTAEPAMAAPARPSLDFSSVTSRYVQSAEGPALELTGVVRNDGTEAVQPEVTLQLAGNRVAIEEPLRLGVAALPPGAERPFTVRLLLPKGAKTVKLLPPEGSTAPARTMPLVSPAWTAEQTR